MGDLLDEDGALCIQKHLISLFGHTHRPSSCPFQPSQKPVAESIRHQVVMSEGHEENEGSVNEFDAHSCKTKAE
jgi:hypothetical protein